MFRVQDKMVGHQLCLTLLCFHRTIKMVKRTTSKNSDSGQAKTRNSGKSWWLFGSLWDPCELLLPQILALDINRENYEIGLPVIQKAGLAHKIDFREGPAMPVLDQLVQDVSSKYSSTILHLISLCWALCVQNFAKTNAFSILKTSLVLPLEMTPIQHISKDAPGKIQWS